MVSNNISKTNFYKSSKYFQVSFKVSLIGSPNSAPALSLYKGFFNGSSTMHNNVFKNVSRLFSLYQVFNTSSRVQGLLYNDTFRAKDCQGSSERCSMNYFSRDTQNLPIKCHRSKTLKVCSQVCFNKGLQQVF